MEIILLKDVESLGYKYDVIAVKNGFARNYLIPQKIAVIANGDNRTKRDEIVNKYEAEMTQRVDEFKAIADKLAGAVVKIVAKAGTSGKIFGSVTSIQLVQAIKDQLGLDVERRMVTIEEEVKTLGTYVAKANLHKEVEASINFEVIAD
jgi:large subunit ribosomal protein L9